MPTWAILALIYAGLLAVAFARVAAKQRELTRAIARMLEVEREFKRSAKRVAVVGKPGAMVELGAGWRTFDLLELRAFAIELDAGDEHLAIAAGTTLQVLAASVTLDPRGIARIAAGATLLCHVPVRREGDPEPRALPPGEVVFLFDDGAQLFARVRFTRETAWARVCAVVAAPAVVLAMIARDGPDTAWNAPAVLGILLLLVDQILAQGLLTWAMCTRPRDPTVWDVRGSP